MPPATRLAAIVAIALAAGADAQIPPPGADGRVFGHLPYPEAAAWELIDAPAGFGAGERCRINRDAYPDLARLLAAADATPSLGGTLRGISCFRSIERQRQVLCRGDDACLMAAARSAEVAPPGHSEHATGYAVDFGIRPSDGCQDVEPCFAYVAAGRWLAANAPRYGFEMSFPFRNTQGVTWEPWHWRWVGTSPTATGAAKARRLFARARAAYPANPRVVDPPPPVIAAPIAPVAVPPLPVRGKKRRTR